MKDRQYDKIYIFDFDGVICDSAIETCITGWKSGQKIWRNMPGSPSKEQIDQFRQVRPYLETGYEAILIVRLLHSGVSVKELCTNYEAYITDIIQQENLQTSYLKQLFGETRDRWISTSEQEWLAMNPLFPTALIRLQGLRDSPWYIVTTKQERFVKRILLSNHIPVQDDQLFGLDQNMSKQDTLIMLTKKHLGASYVFIEDRVQTLLGIQRNRLLQSVNKLELQLVTWGYNTPEDRRLARENGIGLVSFFD